MRACMCDNVNLWLPKNQGMLLAKVAGIPCTYFIGMARKSRPTSPLPIFSKDTIGAIANRLKIDK